VLESNSGKYNVTLDLCYALIWCTVWGTGPATLNSKQYERVGSIKSVFRVMVHFGAFARVNNHA